MTRYRHAYSRETTLAKVADTFRESIIDQRFNHYTEIIIRVHEHAVLRMTIYTYGNQKWGLQRRDEE